MKSRIALAGQFIALFPPMSLASPPKPESINSHSIKAAPKAAKNVAMYECGKCHLKVSVAV